MSDDDDFAQPGWKRWLLNRFVLVPAALILITLGWNAWVATHQHGIIAGRVVNASGAPVTTQRVRV